MTNSFITYTASDISALVKIREGETKLGEQVDVLENDQMLESSPAKFVLLGIPEDIGVAANYGVRGAATAWAATLQCLLNTQSNIFLHGGQLLILGHFDFRLPESNGRDELMKQVAFIDEQVHPLIHRIVAAGKIPIVIGGGHNNAYPIIEGTATALNKKINVINIDAHADLRRTEGRHSGNGFSYALKNAYLGQYRVFGLQQVYVNMDMMETIENTPEISVVYLEDLLLTNDFAQIFEVFISDINTPIGLEIDMDAITGVLSSAATPSGIPLNSLRKILITMRPKLSYLHICEAASTMADGRTDSATGKIISYLITDFIKAQCAKY